MWWFAYIAAEEPDGHADDEVCPEDVQTLECNHESVKEVVTKEGFVDGDGVHNGAVHDPETEQNKWS